MTDENKQVSAPVEKTVADEVAKVLGISGAAAWKPANPLSHRQSGVQYGKERQRNASVVRQV